MSALVIVDEVKAHFGDDGVLLVRTEIKEEKI
jgi:hypothetical protein